MARDEGGKFEQIGDEPLSDRVYGFRIPISWENAVRGLPNQAEYFRAAVEQKLIDDRHLVHPRPKSSRVSG